MHSFLTFLFSLKVALCSCGPEVKRSGFSRARSAYSVRKVGRLPSVVNESSGLVFRGIDPQTGQRLFWTHNDSGGRPTLYGVSEKGDLVDSLPLPTATNVDWEDLASQDATIFVADIGNNANNRSWLIIYRVEPTNPAAIEQIRYRYADNVDANSGSSLHNFDSEALIYFENQLFTFSKNRSLTDRYVRVYRLPASAGEYQVVAQDSIYIKSMVTGGAISPDKKTFALVSYGKVFLFGITGKTLDFRKPLACVRVPRGQTEAICFVSATDLVISNEKGKLFLLRRRTPKGITSQ